MIYSMNRWVVGARPRTQDETRDWSYHPIEETVVQDAGDSRLTRLSTVLLSEWMVAPTLAWPVGPFGWL